MSVLYAGLICWLATLILVESFVAEPLREATLGWRNVRIDRALETGTLRDIRIARLGEKLTYLVNCQLCSGVWIGLVLALIIPGPLPMVLNGLLYKAVAHIILEVVAVLQRASR